MKRKMPTRQEVDNYLWRDHNWGRWGDDDQNGSLNLIGPDKRLEAIRLVTIGKPVSMSRDFPKTPAPGNPLPAHHYMKRGTRAADGGAATDYIGISYHGVASTHIDALCHTWDKNGMWNGRNPDDELTFDGSNWGSIDAWREGILTRGVLLDVPRFRGVPYVTTDTSVHGDELDEIAKHQGVSVKPGDALVIYSGRGAWDSENPIWGSDPEGRPGLHASCLKFIRQTDVAILVWDMMDEVPNEYGLPWTVHGAIFAYGTALVDNCSLEALAATCNELGRYEFMFSLNPLPIVGGTGSPANPIAYF